MDKRSLEILKQRAINLAQPKSNDLETGIQIECLIFEMGDIQYAIETAYIDKVLQIDSIFSIPGVPPFILGIINDGGRVISINDGSQIFGLPEIDMYSPYTILILKNETIEIGLIVESVLRIQKISRNDISTDILGNLSKANYQVGLTKDQILFLDGDLMLKTPRIIIDQSQNIWLIDKL